MTVNIGMIGLTAAGNYGDDLIALAVAQAVSEAVPDAVLHYVDFGRGLDLRPPAPVASHRFRSCGYSPSKDLPLSRRAGSLFRNCDAVIFGGGGLLQTSHHPERPYHWLRFLPRESDSVPVLAVGLGLGPISPVWQERLRRAGSPFDACYVRDNDSADYARSSLGWEVALCEDFVDSEFISLIADPVSAGTDRTILGVALRAWPGLREHETAKHVRTVAEQVGADEVRFYVLEAPAGGIDVRFSRAVAAAVTAFPTSERLYDGNEVVSFTRDLARCSVAISMKLHSSAVWNACGTSIFPISYAPKTAAMFGVPYEGLRVFKEPHEVVEQIEVARAQSIVGDWLRGELTVEPHRRPRSFMSRFQRLGGQVRSFRVNVARKIRQFWVRSNRDRP